MSSLGVPELLLAAAVAFLLWGATRLSASEPRPSIPSDEATERAGARAYLDRMFGRP